LAREIAIDDCEDVEVEDERDAKKKRRDELQE
jgi:hypothetical protein